MKSGLLERSNHDASIAPRATPPTFESDTSGAGQARFHPVDQAATTETPVEQLFNQRSTTDCDYEIDDKKILERCDIGVVTLMNVFYLR